MDWSLGMRFAFCAGCCKHLGEHGSGEEEPSAALSCCGTETRPRKEESDMANAQARANTSCGALVRKARGPTGADKQRLCGGLKRSIEYPPQIDPLVCQQLLPNSVLSTWLRCHQQRTHSVCSFPFKQERIKRRFTYATGT